MKIVIGADGTAYAYKEKIKEYLATKENVEVIDAGEDSDAPTYYADAAEKACLEIIKGNAERGILVCGGGNGMLIAANKMPGIRATLAFNSYALEKSVTSSCCQVVCFGSQVTTLPVAYKLIDEWLKCEYPKEYSMYVQKVIDLENKYRK